MDNWKEKTLEILQGERTKMHRSDIAFYQIDRFERIIHRVDEFSTDCDTCRSIQAEISGYIPQIHAMINGKARDKRLYERFQEKQMKHLAVQHQIYSFNYFTSRFTLIGLIAGLIIGFLLASLFTDYFHPLWIGATSLGLIISYYLAYRKEMGLRRKNQII
jgi:hypothetical protein